MSDDILKVETIAGDFCAALHERALALGFHSPLPLLFVERREFPRGSTSAFVEHGRERVESTSEYPEYKS